jgi:hypothetical protein
VNAPVQLDAHWALYGKRPGSREDYNVLAASPLFSHDEFASIISHFSPGTPPTRRSSEDESLSHHRNVGELPWIVLNWAGRDDELHLGLAIQRATTEVDGVGRQIAETSYFFVSYAALAEHSVSYADLYEVVKDVPLPREDGAPITLDQVPVLDCDEMARRIASIGEGSVSLVAHRLLNGPVTITKADGSSVDERLRFLDAVAAMLPYGYRTRLAASTWSDSGVRHRMRLSFAERRNAGAEVYQWRSEPDRVPAKPGGYLAQLERLRGRSDDSLQKFELSDIIGCLAADTTAQRFDQPRHAVDRLALIDLPFAVLSAVRAKRAEQRRVRELFADDRVLELPAEWRVEVFAELVSYAELADWAKVTQWWTTIAPVNPPALVPALATACRRHLWADSPDVDVADKHVELAARHGLTDQLLSRVIELPERPQALARGLAPGAWLLQKWIMEGGGRYEDFRQSRDALWHNPALACELTAQVAMSAGRGKTQKIEWLRQAMPGLAPFADLAGNESRPVRADTIAMLAGADLRCVGSLLRVANHCHRLGQVLPGLTWWLGSRTDIEPPVRGYIGEQLSALSPRTIEQAADADLALLAAGYPVSFTRNCSTNSQARRYARQFADQWNAIVRYNGSDRPDPFEIAFARSLDTGMWTENALLASVVVDVCGQLTPKNGRPRFRGLVASVLNATPEARNWPFAVDWIKNFHNQQNTARNTMGSLARLPAKAPPEQIGAVCYRAFVNQVPAKSAGSALAESEALNQAPDVNEVLSAVRSVFWADPAPADRGPLRRLLTAVFASEQDRLRGWIDDVIKAAARRRNEPR